jgi:vitamin B12/bleomycin/antimicrobial peptide transport system ATP-binding/permease protein
VTARYLDRRTYLRMIASADIDNPDQRIAEDIRAFTTSTLSFTLIFLNSILAVASFSGVLWMISPLLFGVAIGYAALGTVMTILLGRPLVWRTMLNSAGKPTSGPRLSMSARTPSRLRSYAAKAG